MADRYHKFDDFDPAWTQGQAWEASSQKKGKNIYGRWNAWRRVHEECKLDYDSGNTFALLKALRICADVDLPIPDWVAAEFSKRLDSWAKLEHKSLDEAFGCKIKKNFRFKNNKHYLDRGVEIVEFINKERIENEKSMKAAVSITKLALGLKIGIRTISEIYSKKSRELGIPIPKPKKKQPKRHAKK